MLTVSLIHLPETGGYRPGAHRRRPSRPAVRLSTPAQSQHLGVAELSAAPFPVSASRQSAAPRRPRADPRLAVCLAASRLQRLANIRASPTVGDAELFASPWSRILAWCPRLAGLASPVSGFQAGRSPRRRAVRLAGLGRLRAASVPAWRSRERDAKGRLANMGYNHWPPLSVRRWSQVLAMRDPAWGSAAEDHDELVAAEESRRMHELRGLIVGQVAEIENLLIHITNQICARTTASPRPARQRRHGAGNILTEVESQLRALDLEEEFEASIQGMRQTIRDRNDIVHAVISIGFSDMGEYGPRVSVISILHDNDGPKQPEKVDTWETHACEDIENCPHYEEDFVDWSWDISEARLERQLNDAYDSLEKCVDIWVRVDKILPQVAPSSASPVSELPPTFETNS